MDGNVQVFSADAVSAAWPVRMPAPSQLIEIYVEDHACCHCGRAARAFHHNILELPMVEDRSEGLHSRRLDRRSRGQRRRYGCGRCLSGTACLSLFGMSVFRMS